MLRNFELRAAARSQLRGSWLPAVGVVLVYTLLWGIASLAIGIGPLLVGGPLTLGLYGYFIHKVRGEAAEIENLFEGFKNFARSFLLFLLEVVFIFLWSLLLIIPGIIKGLSYSMALYILHDNPGMSSLDAISASRRMMKGCKGQLFCLYLSFIGWALLCLLTLGIGGFWLAPYVNLSVANFYESLKNAQGSYSQGSCSPGQPEVQPGQNTPAL
jgi:uncharacterized membrane protein